MNKQTLTFSIFHSSLMIPLFSVEINFRCMSAMWCEDIFVDLVKIYIYFIVEGKFIFKVFFRTKSTYCQ